MIGIGIASSLGVNLSGLNPATRSFVTSAGISDANTVLAINNLINGLQADGLWPKMKAIYPFATDNRNLLGYTEDFTNATWTKGPNVTITGNTVLAPNGTLTADSINVTSTSAKYILQDITYSGSHTFSIYAKYQSLQFIQLLISTDTTKFVNFDILNGLVTRQDNSVGFIENVGNGWFRCSMSYTATSQTQVLLGVINSGTSTRVQSNSLVGTSYIWGAQLETGSLSTYQRIATTQQAYISNQFKFNLVNPVDSDAAFRLVFNGGWTHSATGALPNGTNGYADTKLIPSTAFSSNNNSFGVYSRTDNINGENFMGTSTTTANRLFMYVKFTALGASQFNHNSQTFANPLLLNSSGYFHSNRIAAGTQKVFVNGALNTTMAANEQGLSTIPIFLSSANISGSASGFSNRQLAFAHFADGLTDTEASNLYTRVQAFQTALSRQV